MAQVTDAELKGMEWASMGDPFVQIQGAGITAPAAQAPEYVTMGDGFNSFPYSSGSAPVGTMISGRITSTAIPS